MWSRPQKREKLHTLSEPSASLMFISILTLDSACKLKVNFQPLIVKMEIKGSKRVNGYE